MRRRILQVVGGLVALVGLSGCWLQPGFDSNHTAFNSLETAITPTNVSGLHVLWTAQLAGPVSDPAVSPQGVYAATGGYPDAGSLTLLDSKTGSTTWSTQVFAAGAGLFTESPVVANGRVYVPTPPVSAILHGSVAVVDATTGAADPSIPAQVDSAVNRGHSFAGTNIICAPPSLCVSSMGVFNDDGTVSWQTDLAVTGLGAPAPTSPAVGAQAIFLGVGNNVERFPLAPPAGYPSSCQQSGATFCTPTWSTSLGATVSGPVLSPDGNTVFAAAGSTVTALDAATGAVLWSGNASATVSASPALAGSSLYVPLSNGEVDVFGSGGCGQATCVPQWTGTTSKSAITHQPAVVGGGVVFTGSADGSLNALPAAGCGRARCKTVWSAQTGSTITGGPVATFGQLYVGTTDGRVLAYGL